MLMKSEFRVISLIHICRARGCRTRRDYQYYNLDIIVTILYKQKRVFKTEAIAEYSFTASSILRTEIELVKTRS